MPRVLVLNNYCLKRVWGEVQRGEKPDHHLFGLNYFESHGFDVEIVPWRDHGAWQRLQALFQRVRFPIPMGDFSQQADAVRRRKTVDLIYAPCQTQLHLLAYLRRAGLWKVPLVAIAHHPFEVGRLSSLRNPFLRAGLLG
ncbi:MAG TPA: hypothetical protein VK968_15835, partial [Roseimicrobium sp.]|nr:hypothetical protein [Roseimicrobium sp.]